MVKPFRARLLLFAVLLLVGSTTSIGPASATASNVSIHKGVLVVRLAPDYTSTAFSCDVSDHVDVTGQSTTIGCGKVKTIHVIGSTRLDILHGFIPSGDFPNLVSGTFDGRGGDDRLETDGSIPWAFDGEAGSDEIAAYFLTDAHLTDAKLTRNGADVSLTGVDEGELNGGSGSDHLIAATFTGPVIINAGAGNDVLTGGSRDDQLMAMDGDDTLTGNGGDDLLDAYVSSAAESGGADTFRGGPGKDTVGAWGTTDMHVAWGTISGAGGDTISSIEAVSVITDAMNPTIDTSAFDGFARMIATSAGSATFKAGNDGSIMRGDAGADSYQGGGGKDTVWLFDNPSGTLTDSAFTSPLGNDTLSMIDAADLRGTSGANTLDGSAFSGPIRFDGNFGTDNLTGGSGDDFFSGVAGGSVTGGGGTDTIYSNAFDGATLINSELNTGYGTTLLSGIEKAELNIYDTGPATVDASAWTRPLIVDGSGYADTVMGGSGPDVMHGWEGDDVLSGNVGDDKLVGGQGADTLNGGADDDVCVGGKGTDTLQGCETKS